MDDVLKQAVTAIKSGDKATGQKLLIPLVQANPRNEYAWLWLAVTMDDPAKRRQCLEKVLAINPNNEQAKQGLAKLQPQSPQPPKKLAELPAKPIDPPPESKLEPVSAEQPPAATNVQWTDRTQMEARLERPLQPPSRLSPGKSSLQKLKKLDSQNTKKCPYCAETIKAEATVCRFCGTDLATGQKAGQTKPQVIIQQVPRKRNWFVTLLAAFGLIALLFCVCTVLLYPSSSPSRQSPQSQPAQVPASDEYQLELLSSSLRQASESYLTTEGQVKNISGESLENIQVVVQLYDGNDNFITSDSAIIDYNPILPGQISPFEVITQDNPVIQRYSISFKFLLGGTIPTKDSRK